MYPQVPLRMMIVGEFLFLRMSFGAIRPYR